MTSSSGGAMWLFGALLLIGLVLLAVVVVRVLGGGISIGRRGVNGERSERPRRSRAWEALDGRYARGELCTEEYQERVRALRKDT